MIDRRNTETHGIRCRRSRTRRSVSPAVQRSIEQLESRVLLSGQAYLLLPPDVLETDGAVNGLLSVSSAPGSDVIFTLSNSEPSRLTVPATATVLAGQTSAIVPITILNNGSLDGLATANITASAAAYVQGAGTIKVHDNESAVVSVSIPAAATEGGGTLVGVISFSDPAINDILVNLSSSNPSRISVPASVIMPAGQTAVNFDLTPANNAVIDGLEFVSVQGNVDNWTSGFDSIIVSDNDNFLTVTLPAGVRWEGQTLTGLGTVGIGGVLPDDLIVDLESSDTTELSVPATVTIPAGQTSASFDLSLLADGLNDGSQTVSVTASATAGVGGIVDGVGNLAVHDADLHHFTMDAISSPKTAGVSFGATARAWNVDNELILVFAGSATLSATGPGGVGLPTTVSFTNGVWSGNVTVPQTADDMQLSVDDGAGHTSSSNTFDVLPPPTAVPDLVPISDTGISDSDNLTSHNNASSSSRLQFMVDNTIPGATVIVSASGRVIGSSVATDTSTLITSIAFNRLTDNNYSITARQKIGALFSADSVGLPITIDSAAPASPGLPDVDASSDSGPHSFDNYTSDTTPLLNISAGPYYRVYRNAVQISTNYETAATFTTSPLANGTHLLSVAAVDAAGNVSVRGPELFMTVDTVSPVRPIAPDLLPASDGGSNKTDNITNILTPTFRVVVVEAYYRVYRDGVQISDNFQLGLDFTTAPQPYGTFNYTVSEVDFAGNVSTQSLPLQVVFDSTLLTAPQLTESSDSGVSSSDRNTFFNGSVARPLLFSIPGTLAGATVTIYADGVPIGSALSAGGTIGVGTNGSNPLADGPHQITVRQQLPAQSLSLESDVTTITVDTAPPGAVVPDLQAASDTGADSSDNITGDNTPTFDIGAAFYSLYRNGLLISDQFATGAFTSTPLTDGTYFFSAIAMDAAGNWAFPTDSLSVTIDTVAPAIEGLPQFDYSASPNALKISFSENVSASLSAASLNLSGASAAVSTAVGYSYDPVTNTATFKLPSSLPNGDYRATIPAGSIIDGSGIPLASEIAFNFFVLTGDVNHDRYVDARDLVIISTNWLQSGKTFGEGDLNYDTVVDAADLSILSQNWQQTLAAPAAPASTAQPTAASRRAPVRTVKRVADLVIGS